MARLTPPKPTQTSAKYKLMDCPVCTEEIVAKISVDATFGEAIVHGPASVDLPVVTELRAFNVLHSCDGPPPEPVKDGSAIVGGPS